MSPKLFPKLLFAAITLPCLAQQSGLSGPISGFVFDEPTRSLRPISGLPGGARLGDALLEDLDWATVSPNGRVALFRKHGEIRFLPLAGDIADPDGVSVSGVIDSPNLATWSLDSSAAGIYSSSTNELQWIRLTSQGVISDPPLPLAGVDGQVVGLCGDSRSGAFFAAVTGSGVYRVSASTGTTMLLELPGVSAVSLQANGNSLWVADRTGARVIEIINPGRDPEPREWIHDAEKFADISAIAVSSDGNFLYLADRETRRLHIFDRSTMTVSSEIELEVPATAFTPMGRESLLLLGQRNKTGEPLYIFEFATTRGVFFVPAGDGRQ